MPGLINSSYTDREIRFLGLWKAFKAFKTLKIFEIIKLSEPFAIFSSLIFESFYHLILVT